MNEWGSLEGWDQCRPRVCAREGACRHWHKRQPWYDAVDLLVASGLTAWSQLAVRLGVDARRMGVLRREGIPESTADVLANKLGLHPSAVWGEAWWHSAAAEGGYNEVAPAPLATAGSMPSPAYTEPR